MTTAEAYRAGAEAMRTAVLARIGDRFRSLAAEVVMIDITPRPPAPPAPPCPWAAITGENP
ncbi:MAG: hypothetical protein K2X46_14195 [Roseomonas sp.]|nr:hypothetical protein [Roseomonas sp.]